MADTGIDPSVFESRTALASFIEAKLYTAVICDSLDELGYRDQAMREYLRPLHAGCCFAGWARTVLCKDVYTAEESPYDKEIEALDSVIEGEVLVVSTGRSIRNAPWGELLSTAAKARGARGAVVDGLVRDVRKIEELAFPVFASGIKPVNSMGRGVVTDYNAEVECGEVRVQPEDLVVADYDGVVVIPRAVVRETIERAYHKAQQEDCSRQDLMNGAYLRDVFAKYGVL
ncbi:MAG: RraA family protein [Bryobacteraceae bacterium]